MNHSDESVSPSQSPADPREQPTLARRSFLAGVGGAAALGAGASMLPGLLGAARGARASFPPPQNDLARANSAYQIRVACAQNNLNAGLAPHPVNSDETLYPDRIGSFSKGLPHNSFGEVDPAAYAALLAATNSGLYADFEAVPAGAPTLQRMRFVNPLGGLAFDLEGVDAGNTTLRAAPAFDSAEEAGEIVENYWMALLRDVPFTDYRWHPLAQQACAELSALSDFRGPKRNGAVVPATLFRDAAPGCDVGPYLSQFWFRSMPFGAQHVEPRMRTVAPGIDYMKTSAEWLAVQNGFRPSATLVFDNSTLRWMRNGRDLGQWVHIDVLHQAYFQAALTMAAVPDPANPFTGGGMGVPPNPGNPYLFSQMQDGFVTFGGPFLFALLTEVSTRALKAVWFQKWFVHRRLRPEAFAGRVHHKLVSGRPYPIHADVLNSNALALIRSQNGGRCFLPMAFPEGSPVHPAYGAGHATVAGACTTILKALFAENQIVINPVVPTGDGLALKVYVAPDAGQMTVGGELNKLAMNVAYGRNIAGVHWRTDGSESLRLGEAVAISVLRDFRLLYAENFGGFTFTTFDGQTITV